MNTAEIGVTLRRLRDRALIRVVGRSSRRLQLVGPRGAAEIVAPEEHRWAQFRSHYPTYDFWLPELCRLVGEQLPTSAIVDVGANIGDTAALIRLHGATNPLICVEPSERFAGYLRENIQRNPRLFGSVRVEQCFIGKPGDALALLEHRGTAQSLRVAGERAGRAADRPQVLPLSAVVEPSTRVGLVKIDTDGYDAEVVESDPKFLEQDQPIIWVEVTPVSEADVHRWMELTRKLAALGYGEAYLFDNFGHFMIRIRDPGTVNADQMRDLLDYVVRARLGRAVVHYLDVCLVPSCMQEVSAAFRARLAAPLAG